MKKTALVVGLLVAVLSGPALADGPEKVLRLKNGRKIQGEIVEETTRAYVVRASGGTTSIPKDAVASVDDLPPKGKPFLEPDLPKAAGREAAPTGASDAAGTRVASRPAPPPASSGPLASRADIDQALATLAAVPAASSEPGAKAARDNALAAARQRLAAAVLAAVLAEPAPTGSTVPATQAAAAEILGGLPPDQVRPLLARALGAADLDKGATLIALIARVGPDDKGVLEEAVLSATERSIAKQKPVEFLEPALRKVGTSRSLGSLYAWLLAPGTDAALVPGIQRMTTDLVNSSPDIDTALRPLGRLVDVVSLPSPPKVSALLSLLGDTRGEMGPLLVKIVAALEPKGTAELTDQQKELLAQGYRTLSTVGTVDCRERLLSSLRGARNEERRLLALDAIGRLDRASGLTSSFLESIVDWMEEVDRSEAERGAAGRALAALTGKAFGADSAAWRAYLRDRKN